MRRKAQNSEDRIEEPEFAVQEYVTVRKKLAVPKLLYNVRTLHMGPGLR